MSTPEAIEARIREALRDPFPEPLSGEGQAAARDLAIHTRLTIWETIPIVETLGVTRARHLLGK